MNAGNRQSREVISRQVLLKQCAWNTVRICGGGNQVGRGIQGFGHKVQQVVCGGSWSEYDRECES